MRLLLYLMIPLSLLGSECENLTGVVPYDSQNHEDYVRQIALDNLDNLVSDTHNSDQDKMQALEDVMSTLNNEKTLKKVYLVDNKPVAFVSYGLQWPFYTNLNSYFKTSFSPVAKMYHLAVDKNYRGNGVGSLLLKNALADCNQRSVNKVTLWTTPYGSLAQVNGKSLDSYYRKFGFKVTRQTKLFETQHTLKLKSNMSKVFALKLLKYLKKK